MRKVNYDRFPSTKITGTILQGWDAVHTLLVECFKVKKVVAVDFYAGVREEEVAGELELLSPTLFINTRNLMKPQDEIKAMTERFMTDDVLFGYVTNLTLNDYFDAEKLEQARKQVADATGRVIIVGSGAAMVAPAEATVVYVDMARWEIQQRFRVHEVKALGVDNREDAVSLQYKRGYFNDWRILDRYKESLFGRVDFWLDTHIANEPRLIDKETFFKGIEETIKNPFRVVPFFDPAPWGGQWMKEVCGLNPEKENYGWCFDCVPEENSLYFEVNGVRFELPSVDLVLLKSRELLGEPVEARFGKDFPIRFDFLDTFDGGNLSVQCHPRTTYIREQFNMPFTQDETYYILDSRQNPQVYLGFQENIRPEEFGEVLKQSQAEGKTIDIEKYVQKFPAHKHDLFLIPNGTVHASGKNCMVLEISSAPYIFTFKMYDWLRLDLNGKPRPLNVQRGMDNLYFERKGERVAKELVCHPEVLEKNEHYTLEHLPTHEKHFYDVHRYTVEDAVEVETEGSCQVWMVVEGKAVRVETREGMRQRFNYAETFVIPAAAATYRIINETPGEKVILVKAFIKKGYGFE